MTINIDRLIEGTMGLCIAYYMPEIADVIVGFEGLRPSPGVLTDMTTAMMTIARIACVLTALRSIYRGFKRRTTDQNV